jgi:hypothetical protein
MRSLPGRERPILLAVRDAILLVLLAAIHFVDSWVPRIVSARSRAGRVAILRLSNGATNPTGNRPLRGLEATASVCSSC